jgi:lipopolysaccharide/colanic/teichoic acid biosynthesis glycosyltransferase
MQNTGTHSVGAEFAKRALDLLIASLGLAISAPLTALVGIAIKLDSRGSVLFRQVRRGRGGTPFQMYKFRTMVEGADSRVDELRPQSLDPHWLHLEKDPRITRVGRFLRMTSLDELPQLWNVLRGEMSIVGPRPLTERDSAHVPHECRVRSAVRPGITGPWQVSGRTHIPFHRMVELDSDYARNWTVRGDLALLVRTLPAVIARRGAN